jgi:cell division protein FtsB
MNRHNELDDLAQVDRLIQDADRRIRDLERTMHEGEADWHHVTQAEDLLAQLRLALVKYKARRAAIAQFIDDMESGRL